MGVDVEESSLGRRALLIAAVAAGAALLSACAPVEPTTSGPSGPPQSEHPSPSGHDRTPAPSHASTATAEPRRASAAPAEPATPTPASTPTATPTPTSTENAQPDRAAVAARFAGAVPTQWGTDVAGVRSTLLAPTGPSGAPRVALTFDACGGGGGSGFDAELIAGLRAAAIPATLFLNSRWIQANPQLAADLAADPLFVLGNHGTAHVPLSVAGRGAYGIPGTRSPQEAVDEVWGNHEVLTGLTGAPPRFFRAGTAHYDEIAAQIVHDLGETPIGFSVNGDGGATFGPGTVRQEFGRAQAGGIVLAHMNHPEGGTSPGALDAVADLLARGFEFVHVDG
ncbi:polysaccharide deacetylase family protein [Microbacterium sp. B2969]|uniref:Polysaccharide deacetylase family protein n=1 Tax=Microbacterium alkaliflavum TaxID=3248839 RepID=A0ABW7QBT2_9MICO